MQNQETQINLFSAYKNRNIIFRIAFTGMFIGIVILFQYLEQFMPFAGTFVNINLTLLFILPIFYFGGPWMGMFSLLMRYIIGTSLTGFNVIHATSNAILFICTLIVIIFMYLYSLIFHSRKFDRKLKLLIISTLTVLTSSIVITILNSILFTPTYFYVLSPNHNGLSSIVDISGAKKAYAYVTPFYFGITNYWVGTSVVYFTANIVKYTIVYVAYFPLAKVIEISASKVQDSWNM